MHPNDGRVVSTFIVQPLRGDPITINGDGSQTRSFCYVYYLVGGIAPFMNKDDGFAGPLNLCNSVEVTIRQLAQAIVEMTASRSEIVSKSLPVDDRERRKPDITVAEQHLGWSPVTDLRKGLSATIEYFSHRLSREGTPA